jgi:transposase
LERFGRRPRPKTEEIRGFPGAAPRRVCPVTANPGEANRRVPREYDRNIYKARHLIENFFAKIKQFRAIATRYDKTARNFLAAVYLTASAVWLN